MQQSKHDIYYREWYLKNKASVIERTKQYKLKKKTDSNIFIMCLYDNMKSRVKSTDRRRFKNYIGLDICTKDDFYLFAKNDSNFKTLFNKWVESGNIKGLAPSVDRINHKLGYTLDNIQFLSLQTNSVKGILEAYNITTDKINKIIKVLQ